MTLLRLAAVLIALAQPAAAFDLPWSSTPEEPPPQPPRPVVSRILSDSDAKLRSFPGVVVAGTEVTLGFQTLGRVASRPVDVGDMVETDALLAELTPDDLQDNVRAARAALSTAEVTLETARATASRVRDLAARNVASRAQLEQAERGLTSAEAGLAQAQSELARAEDAEGFARLLAPFEGVISAVFENPGAVVSAGSPIVTLSDVDSREAVIDLPEPVLAKLPEDAELEIWAESDPESRSTGHVIRIEPLADAATRTRRVHLSLSDSANYRLGALIRARLLSQSGPILTLPEVAIMADGDRKMVWVVTRNGDDAHVTAREITAGPGLDGEVEVTWGLSAGDEVVLRGIHSLTEGQNVGRSVAP